MGNVAAGRCRATNASLRRIIGLAYDLPIFTAEQYISGGPGWISSERYDIEAKAANPSASGADLRLMLQSLLADRFKLRLHPENKVVAGYVLVISKGGLKLRRPEERGRSEKIIRVGIGASNTAELVMQLSSRLDAPVVDKTNLTGEHDFFLTWESLYNDDAPSIFTVLEEQLALKLVSQKVPLRVLVIDHVEKPTEN